MRFFTRFALAAVLVFAAAAVIIAGNDAPKEATPTTPTPEGIQWVSYDVGLERAEKENKHVFIDFTAKWCGYCKKMEAETFSQPEVIAMVNANFIPVKVDGDSQKELDVDGFKITESNLTKQEFGVRGYPTFWFLKPDGTKLGAISGYRPASVMMEALSFVKDEQYDTTSTDTAGSTGSVD